MSLVVHERARAQLPNPGKLSSMLAEKPTTLRRVDQAMLKTRI
jgi:hypothetical protein